MLHAPCSMLYKKLFKLTITVITIGTLTSCLALKEFKEPELEEVENLYPFEKITLDSTSLANMPWQKLFDDSQLQDLINEALQNNLTLKQAIQQIKIAKAGYIQSKKAYLPRLNIGGDGSFVHPSDNGINGETGISLASRFNISANTSWEVPIWGKLTSAKRAAYAQLIQTEVARRAVRTRLIASVANAYYRLLALEAQLAIAKETVQNRVASLETLTALKQAGRVSGAAVQQSIAIRYAAEVLIPDLKQRIVETENFISNLLGRPPGPIESTSLAAQEPLSAPDAGIPASLLRNRPDIIRAEYAFRQAFHLTNNARTYFYPSIRLTASGGFRSLILSDLLQPASIFANVIAGLTQPIFNNGINEARLTSAKARQKQALLQLKQTIITAGSEVTNALSSYKKAKEKLELREKQLEALQKAVNYAEKLLKYGQATYINVLTARQNLLAARLNAVNDKLQRLTAGVTLYRALGGGWKSFAERSPQ